MEKCKMCTCLNTCIHVDVHARARTHAHMCTRATNALASSLHQEVFTIVLKVVQKGLCKVLGADVLQSASGSQL
eukprot:scaffold2271_cov17-Tisochrysis_lutea.AAC.1